MLRALPSRLVRGVQLLFLLIGAAVATIAPYVSVMLRERGFEPAAIGLVTAISALGFTFAVPIWGHLADVTLGRSRALQLAAIGAAAAMAAFGLPLPGILRGTMIVLYNVFQSAFMPIADAIAMTFLRDPARGYGRLRVLTSFSYAIVVIAVGFLYDATGFVLAPFLWAAGTLLLAAGLVLIREPRHGRLVIRHGRGGSARMALAVQPRLPAVLLTLALTFAAIMGSYTFLGLRLVELGGAPSSLGLSGGLGALAEIPGLVVASRIAHRIGLRGLFVGSAFVYSVAILSWAFVGSPELIILSRFLSGPAFAGLAVSSVLTISVLLPLRLQATGQALYQTIAFGVAAMLANAVGGVIYEELGPPMLFGVMAAASFAAAGLGWFVLPRAGEERPAELDEHVEVQAAGPT